ncbi:MAG TPA: amino acid adenylation domain-containing protein [Longimicrobium sp.]|nr:amino acid adenylation domain-containing protein [Longimicrobium sp.]
MSAHPPLSPAKEALRAARLAGQQRAAPIPRRAPGTDAPLSYGQEQLWFVDQLQPGGTAYNLPVVLRLSGPVDAGAMERAIGEVVRRHESLRTTVREAEGVPAQSVAPFRGFTLAVDDLSALDVEEREREVTRRGAAEASHVFSLSTGPLFRASLLRLGEDDHALLMCLHHLVGDGWSVKVLLHEVSVLYDAFRQGRPSPLPEPPIQYGDYAAWQRAQVEGTGARHLAYWKRQLAGAPELLELPTDRPRPSAPSFRGARVRLWASAEVLEGLRALAHDTGATLHMVVLAAFQALLGRHAGTDDVLVGSPVAGRARKETEGLIGMFANALVLRGDLSGDPAFRELVERVREVALAAYQHQDAPFERVVAELAPRRSLSHSALYQVIFRLDEIGGAGVVDAGAGVGGVRTRAVPPEQNTTAFDLTFAATVHANGLGGTLEYATDLFDEFTARRLAAQLERVLAQVAAHPETRLSALELMDADERARVLEAWNRTAAPFDRACIHHLFARQAARTPQAVAVVYGDDALTYRELDERANRLAHHLAALGAGPEMPVALCVERSTAMLVAMLAILKSGAAYLPLDPAYPRGRLKHMLADSGASLLVTQHSLRALLPSDEIRTVLIDAHAAEIAARPGDAPASEVTAGNAAYVIYTSGSTGLPKGVQVTHANAAALFAGLDERVGGPAPGTWLAVARTSFDAHVPELLWTLTRGFRVIVHPDLQQAAETGSVAAAIRRHGVTHLQCTPSLAWMLVAEGGAESLAGLQRLLIGAEAFPPDLAARLHAALPGRLVNLYGPTEATVWSTTHEVGEPGTAVPIGRPIANTRVYVLSPALHAQPVGVPGELCIGGAGVARGYLRRAGMTAERFIPDPFGSVPGSRLYRTGDRARWRADGTLEYRGRLDQQVKVRGIRIEPGEIEAVLRRHPSVRDCAVVAREHAPGDMRLAAYVVGDANAEALREHLREHLPEVMVPAAFVSLGALPLTPSGKLDRGALPAPEYASPERYVAPRTAVEAMLAEIWGQVLKLERVGVRENFFELGGHSLLATRIVSRVRGTFGIELPLRALFQSPTVAGLAERYFGGMAGPEGEERAGVEASPNRLLAVIDELTEEELDLLLTGEPENRNYR